MLSLDPVGDDERSPHPFAVDRHLHVGVDAEVGDLGDVFDAFHVRGIAASAENAGNAGLGVHVVRRDKRARSITC